MSSELSDKSASKQSQYDILPEKRGCTDKLCLLLIFGMWIAMVLVGLMAMGDIPARYIQQGNPELLTHGVDYEGNICGVDDPVKSLPKRVFPNFYGSNADSEGSLVPTLLAVCTASCPGNGDIITDPYGTYGTWTSPDDSQAFLNNCLYLTESSGETSGTTILSDFIHTAGMIGILGFLLAVILSLLFLFIVRIPLILRMVVWACAALIQGILTASALYFLSESSKANGGYSSFCHCSTEIVLLKALGGVLLVMAVLWAALLGFWRKKIALAISLVRESCTALTSMPLICFMPMLQTCAFAAFTALWMLFSVYLVSSGTLTTHTDSLTGYSYKSIDYDTATQRAILFMVFAWLWSIGYIEAVGQMSCAHAVLVWYFAPIRADITSLQIVSSVGTVMYHHTGSAAMGSLLITLLRGMRLTLEAIKRLDKPQANWLSRSILRISQCLLGCLEGCVKYLTKHAYIQVALTGQGFLPSAAAAYILLITNLSQLAAVSVVSDFVVLVGKLSISLTCAGLGYVYMVKYMQDQLNGFILPTVFVFVVAFLTSTMFLSVLSATCDALLQACIVDEKRGDYRRDDCKGLYQLVRENKSQWQEEQECLEGMEDVGDDIEMQHVTINGEESKLLECAASRPIPVPNAMHGSMQKQKPVKPSRGRVTFQDTPVHAPAHVPVPVRPDPLPPPVPAVAQLVGQRVSMGNSASRYATGPKASAPAAAVPKKKQNSFWD